MRIVLAFAAFVLLSGCIVGDMEFGPSDRFQSDFHYAYPLQPGGRVNIESFNGSVEIAGWDEGKVDISGTKFGSSESLRDAVKIEVHNSPESVDVRTVRPSAHPGGSGARYTVRVPRGAVLDRIVTSNGSIRVREVASATHVKTSNGAVRLENIAGDVDARTSNGSIDADGVRGGAQFRTSNGRITAENLSGSVDAETSNSSIKIRLRTAPPQAIRTVTSNGAIDLAIAQSPKASVRAETSNGSITLRLPDGAAANLVASTRNSSIHSDFEVSGSNRDERGRRNQLEGAIGGGGPSIDLSTHNGQIRILKGMAE